MCDMYREALHLQTKYLLYKFLFISFITFTSPKPAQVKYIIYVYINTALSFKSSITKSYYCCMALSLLFLILFNIQKEHLYFGSRSSQYYCVTLCHHARNINYFPCKGQFNKSGNFTITQGKFNSYKEVRGRWHIPAYSPKHVPLAEYCFKKLNDKQIQGFLYNPSTLHLIYIHDKFM